MQESTLNISTSELKNLDSWLADVSNQTPSSIKETIKNLSLLPSHLAQSAGNKEALLRLLKTLMKLTPSTEKGTLGPKL